MNLYEIYMYAERRVSFDTLGESDFLSCVLRTL